MSKYWTMSVILTALVLALGAATADEKSRIKPPLPAARQKALFERLNAAEAWQVTKGDPKVLVGVIDNGFDFYHPDLKGQLIPGYYYPGGYHTEFYENIAHGTLVASLIVARGDNSQAMSGLAPHCKVLTTSQGCIEHVLLKLRNQYFRDHPKATETEFQLETLKHWGEVTKFAKAWPLYQCENAAEAIRYLVDRGVKVINYSGGLVRRFCPSAEVWRKVEDAFAYAAQKNVVIVLSAGNSAQRWEDYPGDADTMIVAGASLLNDTRWEQTTEQRGLKLKQGSNFGKRLTVMAPVEKLLVCMPHDRRVYETLDGPMGPMKEPFRGAHQVLPIGATSCAAPVVSSLVALVYCVRPDLDARSVVAVVKKGCDPLGEGGFDERTGYGRVNFGKTIRLAQTWGK
jgi:subtilisin family serine protease